MIFKPKLKQSILSPNTKSYNQAYEKAYEKSQFERLMKRRSKYQFIDEAQKLPFNLRNKYSMSNLSDDEFKQKIHEQIQNEMSESKINLNNKFEPILPKFIFKKSIEDSLLQSFSDSKKNNQSSGQFIDELKMRKLAYPKQVQNLIRQYEESKLKTSTSKETKIEQEKNQIDLNKKDIEYNISLQKKLYKKALKIFPKVPYYPLMGARQDLFWSHSVNKVVFWYYPYNDLNNAKVIATIDFSTEVEPISTIQATFSKHYLFQHQQKIVICVGFSKNMKLYTFDMQKWRLDEMKHENKIVEGQSKQAILQQTNRYLQSMMIRVQSDFPIRKILLINFGLNLGTDKQEALHDKSPLIIFANGGQHLQIVDLTRLKAFKSYQGSIFNSKLNSLKSRQNLNQNQIIKLLHMRDSQNPQTNYVCILRKQIKSQIKWVDGRNVIQKMKNFISCKKKTIKKQQMIITVYSWNQKQLYQNSSLWSYLNPPSKIRKIKQMSSSQLQDKIKQTFYEFYSLNHNNNFIIADISLTNDKRQTHNILMNDRISKNMQKQLLQVTFSNGAIVLFNNLKYFNFIGKINTISYIQKNLPMIGITYEDYRVKLTEGKFLKNHNEVKNKHNYYIYQPLSSQRQHKYALIDQVISQNQGLYLCEDKYLYKGSNQISYSFKESNKRKEIHKLTNNGNSNEKQFLVFEREHMNLIQTVNLSENLLIYGYMIQKYPERKQTIIQYIERYMSRLSQDKRLNMIQQSISLLIKIDAMGKTQFQNFQNRLIDHIMQSFLHKSPNSLSSGNKNQLNQTTNSYQSEKGDKSKKKTKQYLYSLKITKRYFENLVQHLMGSSFIQDQKLKGSTQSTADTLFLDSFTTLEINVSDQMYNFLWQFIMSYGMKKTSANNFSTLGYSNIQKFLSSYNNQTNKIQTNPASTLVLSFLNNSEPQSYFSVALSQYILGLVKPFLDVNFKKYTFIQTRYFKCIEKLQQFKKFLSTLIDQSVSMSLLNKQIFTQTIQIARVLKGSISKIILIMRLFDTLGQQYGLKNKLSPCLNHSGQYDKQQENISLKNLLFDSNKKQALARLAVEYLFQDNYQILDQLQEQLPEIQIKHVRYYYGWKKMNKNLLQFPISDEIDHYQSGVIAKFAHWMTEQTFQKRHKQSTIQNGLKNLSTMEIENNQNKKKQGISHLSNEQMSTDEINWIVQSLDEHSYEDYAKYFKLKQMNKQFIEIMLSKISSLQQTFIQLKQKYSFDENFGNWKGSWSENTSFKNNFELQSKKPFNLQEKYKTLILKEQKINSYQKYKATAILMQSLNSKLAHFIRETIIAHQKMITYSKLNPQQKEKKNVNNKVNSSHKRKAWEVFLEQDLKHNKNKIEILSKNIQHSQNQIKAIIKFILSKGSDFLKAELYRQLSASTLKQGKDGFYEIKDFKDILRSHCFQQSSIDKRQSYIKKQQSLFKPVLLKQYNQLNDKMIPKYEQLVQMKGKFKGQVQIKRRNLENKQKMFSQKLHQNHTELNKDFSNNCAWMREYHKANPFK